MKTTVKSILVLIVFSAILCGGCFGFSRAPALTEEEMAKIFPAGFSVWEGEYEGIVRYTSKTNVESIFPATLSVSKSGDKAYIVLRSPTAEFTDTEPLGGRKMTIRKDFEWLARVNPQNFASPAATVVEEIPLAEMKILNTMKAEVKGDHLTGTLAKSQLRKNGNAYTYYRIFLDFTRK